MIDPNTQARISSDVTYGQPQHSNSASVPVNTDNHFEVRHGLVGHYRGLAVCQKCHRNKADIRHRLSYSRMACAEISLRQTKCSSMPTCAKYTLRTAFKQTEVRIYVNLFCTSPSVSLGRSLWNMRAQPSCPTPSKLCALRH
jgi:hypothetical protein